MKNNFGALLLVGVVGFVGSLLLTWADNRGKEISKRRSTAIKTGVWISVVTILGLGVSFLASFPTFVNVGHYIGTVGFFAAVVAVCWINFARARKSSELTSRASKSRNSLRGTWLSQSSSPSSPESP